MHEKPDKFVWPPNPLSPADLAAPAEHLSDGAAHLLTHTFDDVSLEEPADELAGNFDESHDLDAIPAPSSRGISRWLESLEIHLLGRTAAPWDIRAKAAHWSADQPGDYCPRCGSTVRPFELDTLNNPPTCIACRKKRPPWSRFIRLAPYRGVLAQSIRQLKFSRFRALGDRLGHLLGESIANELASENIARSRAIIVPVPMTPWRRLSRGVDHTLVIARGIRRATRLPIAHLLVRRHRPSQLQVPPSQRRQNIAGAFYCRRSVLKVPADAVLIVVDDVRTTGATMIEACRTLQAALKCRDDPDIAQTRVWGAALGVTDRSSDQNSGKRASEIV